jgi:hypothetical protein
MSAVDDALQVLREIAGRRRYNNNRHYPSRPVSHVTVNLPIGLVLRMDAALAAIDGLERPPVSDGTP